MKFRTEYTAVPETGFQLEYDRGVVTLGSCFADNIGQRLVETGWQAEVNPCGVHYNPLSIAQAIEHALDPDYRPELRVHPVTGMAYCLDFSTKFSRLEPEDALSVMYDSLACLREALTSAQVLMVTFGTSWVYELADTGRVVANCHKLPAATFRRRCCSIQEMTAAWYSIIDRLTGGRTGCASLQLNPQLKFIFTVSPVRHLADGFAGNARSKARLLLLCEQLAQLPNATYFPAYEILTDDLRDYRFYADDLAHPSPMGADYIFSKFADTYIPSSALPLMAAARRDRLRAAHRPILLKTRVRDKTPQNQTTTY